jgi:DNA-binding transcriptional ArsR family regulator
VFLLHAQICKALADPTRLLILVELRDRGRTVGELSRSLGASQSLTSRHLALLRHKGVVVAERDGSYVRYTLADRRILTAIEILLDVLATQLARNAASRSVVRRLRPLRRSIA